MPRSLIKQPHVVRRNALPFQCPYCNTEIPPHVEKKLTTGGWILFTFLLLFFFPLCWIPFASDGLKEIVQTCSNCGVKLHAVRLCDPEPVNRDESGAGILAPHQPQISSD
jgi:LITAF-like zinc ribbon domain